MGRSIAAPLHGMLRKLAQESHVALKEHLDVVDAVLQHREAIDADAESETADFFRVVAHESVHRGIDHARAEELDPARALALRARSTAGRNAAAAAEHARNVELDRRLGERKITWPEARFHAGTEKLFYEVFDRAGEVAEGDVGIDREPFDLMEGEGVRRVGIVAAIDLAGNDHAYGRLALFHRADLHRRSVRAQQERRRRTLRKVDIKGVHVVADGMKFGNVERLEVVVRRFDFRTFDDGKADRDEDVFDFLENLADQMMRTDGTRYAGEREIDAFARQRRFVRASFDRDALRLDLRFDVRAQFVELGADNALQIRSRGLEPIVGDEREDARFAAEPCIAELLPRRFIVHGGNFAVEPRDDFREQRGDARGLGRAERGERLRSFVVRRSHDRNPAGARRAVPVFRLLQSEPESQKRLSRLAWLLTGAEQAPAPTQTWRNYSFSRTAFFGAGTAAFAVATRAVNAAASFTAISASTLRSSSTPATFNP